ncbi:MAG TPA: MarR family winged helix-turn-helix transcriptional regulator [Sphingomicrobium sp.]|nr:MarR family winged helix-turn-helix transcriptional regulator [Sphingomicrobium sp.]
MDAIQSNVDISYSDEPPVVIAATSVAAMSRAVSTVHASGFRVAAEVPLGEARSRIERQATARAVWLELDADCGGAMDELLQRISRDVNDGRYAAVVSTTAALIDPVMASLPDSRVEIVIDGSDSDRVAALALAAARAGIPARLSDVASDQSAARLRQLSDEVSRIAATLARLSAGPAAAPQTSEPSARGDAPVVAQETVRSIIRARRLRARYFSEELFADPAWDMLLDLLQAEIAQLRVPVSSLCIAAAVPATTALRWLKTMVDHDLFVRRADPHDGRRVFVELAPEASHALRRYFAEIGPVPVI